MSCKELGPQHPQAIRNLRIVLGIMICLATVAVNPLLADISNIVRFTVIALSLIIAIFLSRYNKEKTSFPSATLLLLLFILLQFASIIWAANKAEALFEASKWFLGISIFFLLYPFVRRHPAHFIVTMSRVSLAVSIVSLAVAAWQISQLGDISWSSRYAITSIFSHKGTYSIMLLLTMTFPIMRLCFRLRKGRVVYYTLIVVHLSMLFFLQSRATWLATISVVFSLIILFVLKDKNRRRSKLLVSIFTLTALVLIVGGTRIYTSLSLPQPTQDGGLLANASIHERQALWRMTFRMIDTHPILGCGAGNWKVCYPSAGTGDVFSINMLDYNFVRPHNDYLRILSEVGYVGLTILLSIIASLWIGVRNTRKHTFLGRNSRISMAFVVGVCVFAMFDFPIDRIEVLLWTVLLGTTASAMSLNISKFAIQPSRWRPLMAVLLIAVFALGCSRWKSESHLAYIVGGIHQRQWQFVENHCNKARTPWCNLTTLGMPLAYYEAMAQEYQHKPAIATFRTALKDSPWCKQVLTDLARLEYTENHNTDLSIALFREAIRISPGYTYAYLNLAQVYIHEQRWNEAIAVLDSLDLDDKEQQLRDMTWHYHQGATVKYYIEQLVPSERMSVERLRKYAESNAICDSSSTSE